MDKREFPNSHDSVCTEKCSIHRDKVINYFCHQHKLLSCHTCAILQHENCELDYIPEKCAGIADSGEYIWTVCQLGTKLETVRSVKKIAALRNQEIEIWHSDQSNEIDQFEKKMTNYIRQRREEIQHQVDKKKELYQSMVEKVIVLCSNVSSAIIEQQSSLQARQIRHQNSQIYIEIKRAMKILDSDEIMKAKAFLNQMNMQFRFEPNQELQEMLLQQGSLGNISLFASFVGPGKKPCTVSKIGSVNVKTKSDQMVCWISGCAVLSSNKIVLADKNNNKLKVLDTCNKYVIEEKELNSYPWDITTLPNGLIAVTLPKRNEILLMRSESTLSLVNTIQVKEKYWGISCRQDHLYVVCQDPNSIVILDTKGKVCDIIILNLNDDVIKDPLFITVNEYSGLMYLNDPVSKSIVCIAGKGERSAVMKDIPMPLGMTLFLEGSLLVCCFNKGTLHHVTGDLMKHQQVLDGLLRPYSLCYNQQQQEIYIGGYNCNQLEVLRVANSDD